MVRAQAAEKVTVASARRWLEVAMACRTVQSSLAATGEELHMSSSDGTDVAPGMVPEAKSKGACTASLGKEAVCEAKSVESPCGLARTPAGSALASVPAVARSDAMATVAGAAGRWRVHPLRRTVSSRRSSHTGSLNGCAIVISEADTTLVRRQSGGAHGLRPTPELSHVYLRGRVKGNPSG